MAAAALPAIASAFAARFLLLSANRFPSAGIRSPVLGAMRNPAEARMPPTASTAAARFFQLASPMSPISFSVTSAETSARGRPSPETSVEDGAERLARTTRVTFSVTSNGLRANSASSAFFCASLSSPRKSSNPGPTPACIAPSNFAAAALHAGFVRPSDALHQSMTCGMPQACTPKSPTAPAQKISASEVTLGFLWPSARRRSCAKTNDGPSASETLVKAATPGPRSLTSASFSATAATTRAPSRVENAGAFAASDASASNALPNTWKFLSSKPGVAARARTVFSAAASHAAGAIALIASATVAMPARRSFQAPDASCPGTSAPYMEDKRSEASSLLSGGAGSTSSFSAGAAAAAPGPADGRVAAAPSRGPAPPGFPLLPLAATRLCAGAFASRVARGRNEAPACFGAGAETFVWARATPHASSTFAFFASSSASTCLAMDRQPPPARPSAASASIAAARTSGSLWSAHLTTAGTSALCAAAAAASRHSGASAAAAIQPSVCAGTLGNLCASAATISSATSATEKHRRENTSSASLFLETTLVFLSLSLSSIPGSNSRASERNSRRKPSASAPAAAHASPTHATFESFVTTFFNARATSPYSPDASLGYAASARSWLSAPSRSFHLPLTTASQNLGCSFSAGAFSSLSSTLSGSQNSYASGRGAGAAKAPFAAATSPSTSMGVEAISDAAKAPFARS